VGLDGTYGEPQEDLSDMLEALMLKYYRMTPFACSVAISADGLRYAAVGVKLHGDSRHRGNGRWTRTAIAASCPVSEGLVGLVPRLRKLYAEFANERHPNVNTFKRRRTRTPVLGGHRRNK
jgi:hypothetical protein